MKETAKIMVVDDERRICQNVAKILATRNYEVVQALSADEALKKMARESFSLLISDIVMPGMNGLELLKLVKKQWPPTKAIMMTAYASTDTAAKAIRLGALDYIPKPFTPEELRTTVDLALTEKLVEASTSEKERDAIDAKRAGVPSERTFIDVDMPFDREEVAKYTDENYTKSLGPSDLPVVEAQAPETLENFCELGNMVCDMFKKLGGTCKGGKKTGECPQIKAKKKKAAEKQKAFDAKELIGIDLPFNYEEVVSITGPEYVMNLDRDGMSFIPYEELKKRVSLQLEAETVSDADVHEYPEAPPHETILVIDDEAAVNNNIRKILLKKGYHVDQALTKSEALAKIEHQAYPLILLDLRIPGVKGLELLRAIREKRPHAKVIIITGYASIETAKETARLGAIDYLAKPFTPEELRVATENAFCLAA
ncbi:MAG: response regulator [Desulfobacterales bacterium]|jgi:DNA-binding response OmpR family regulator